MVGVLEQYIKVGVGALYRSKLPQLLELKYHAIRDAVAELGSVVCKMAINTNRAKAAPDKTASIINAGGSVPDRGEKATNKEDNSTEQNDVRFTVTMPYEMASIIDRLRKPTKTSRQAWLMQAAEKQLKEMRENGDL